MADDLLWEEEEEESFDAAAAADIDAALLMELLEEEQQHGEEEEEEEEVADDDSRLRSVIRSLEAEISAAAGDEAMLLDSVHRHEDCEDCRMDDILAGVDSHGSCSTSAAAMAHVEDLEEPFGWVEMVAAAEEEESPCGGDMADWYVDECIDALLGAGYGELRGQYAASVDEQFCSLWDL